MINSQEPAPQKKRGQAKTKKDIFFAILKFVPVIILAAMMIGRIDALIAAPVATIAAVFIARITEGLTFDDCIKASTESIQHILVALFILMFAYAMASSFMSTGVGASVVNIALGLGITARTTAVVSLVVTAILSVATGSSWGTFAACAPIFLWLIQIVDPSCQETGSLLLVTCATAGGACFGDNIGLISDTTIVSSGIQGVRVVDRIRTQGVWSISCLILAAVFFYIAGVKMGLPTTLADTSGVLDIIPESAITYLEGAKPEAVILLNQIETGVPWFMIIPLIIVIGLAIAGLNTFVCIGSGILSSYIFGIAAGTTSFSNGGLMAFLTQCKDSFGAAGSWVIVMMMWIAAFGGIMGKMRAFDPLAEFVVKISRSVRSLMFCNGILSLAGNFILADEMAQIVTVGPIIKTITEENVEASEEDMYKLKLRNATFGDAMAVFGSQMIPWHVYLAYYVGIASNVFPIYTFKGTDFIKYNFLAIIAVVSILVLTRTGGDKFVPMFGLPDEPEARLKKSIDVMSEPTPEEPVSAE